MLICICEACARQFQLVADEDYLSKADIEANKTADMPKAVVGMRGCESGGIYAVYVDCPRCEHTHELR